MTRRIWMQYRVMFCIAMLVLITCAGRAFMAWPDQPIGMEAMRWSQDTDPWLRLTLVRDWMEDGSWYDHEMQRSNAPYGGTQSPWTRPLDVVIAGIAALMEGDVSTRLLKAALVLPCVWAVLLALGIMRAARRLLAHPDAVLIGFALVATIPAMWSYFGIGNADHHAPLAVLCVWVVGCLFGTAPRDALWAGVLLGLMLWISPEALMIIGLVLGFGAARYILHGEGLRYYLLLSVMMSVTVTVAVGIERAPAQWWVAQYDTVSMVHVLALSVVSAALSALMLLEHAAKVCCPVRRAVAVMFIGAIAAIIMIAAYSDFFAGPMVGVDAFIFTDFLPHINEAQPLWRQDSVMMAVAVLWQPVLSVLAMLLYYLKNIRGSQGGGDAGVRNFVLICVFLCGLFAACMAQLRFYYYLAPLVGLALMLVVAPLFTPLHASVSARWPARALLGEDAGFVVWLRQTVLMGIVLVPYIIGIFAPDVDSAKTPSLLTRGQYCEMLASMWMRTGGLTRDVGTEPRTVLMGTDIATQVLFFSPHRIVASNYHREGAAIRYVWEALKVTDMAAFRQYLAKRDVDVVLVCPDGDMPEDSVMLGLYQGTQAIPAWLAPMQMTSMPHWRGLPKQLYEPKLFRVLK